MARGRTTHPERLTKRQRQRSGKILQSRRDKKRNEYERKHPPTY